MGIYTCENCCDENIGAPFACKACARGEGDDHNVCESCAGDYKCGRCNRECCYKCNKIFWCCGLVLCGYGNADNVDQEYMSSITERSACIWEHEVRELECGHPGCSYRENEGLGCYICYRKDGAKEEEVAIDADIKLVETWIEDKIASVSLKEALKEWLLDPFRKEKKVDEGVRAGEKRHRVCP